MSDYMADLSNLVNINGLGTEDVKLKNGGAGKSKLEMDDYLQLMVAMFQNQSMDDTADIGDMMNNMVQMSVVEAITSVTSLIQESTALNYAASLVGKDVTVGELVNNQLVEHYGTVTGTGTYNGQQVIFMGEECYYVNSIMAVGRLPSNTEAIQPDTAAKSDEILAAEAAAAAAEAAARAAQAAAESAVFAAANGTASDTVSEAGAVGQTAQAEEARQTDGAGPAAEAAGAAEQTDETPSAQELAEETLAEQGSEAAAEETIT